MTMTSDEKRREVAQTLRWLDESIDERGESRPLEHDAMLLRAIRAVVGKGDIFHLLADLIDPTCHLVETTSEEGFYGPEIFHHELSCGHTCHTDCPEPPAFCDECGARVVEDEEDDEW